MLSFNVTFAAQNENYTSEKKFTANFRNSATLPLWTTTKTHIHIFHDENVKAPFPLSIDIFPG